MAAEPAFRTPIKAVAAPDVVLATPGSAEPAAPWSGESGQRRRRRRAFVCVCARGGGSPCNLSPPK